VYRADLNPPVMNAEHGKAAGLDRAGRGRPNRKAGWQEQQWDDRRSKSRHVMCRISPHRSGLERREKYVEPLQVGNCNRRATPVARCTQSCCPKEHSHDGHDSVLPSCPRELRCAFVIQRVVTGRGSARKGLALERFEPCEGKLSRTVLRGAWAG
jgi:hypothetical protein